MPILNSTFSKLLEKATSNLQLEADWPTILSICDLIRQGDVSSKVALTAVNKKITHDNPHVAGFGLLVLESMVKNCGSLIHEEVCTKQYMEQLKEIAKTTHEESVRTKILELIQAWAYAFRDVPKYRAVQDTMRIMKSENFEFPKLQESDAMFTADIAPGWAEGDDCHRCRAKFSLVLRKHHCRNCGQVFCNQCSAKTSTLPKFGIEKEVRVCIPCHNELNKPIVSVKQESDLPSEYLNSSLAQQQQVPPRKTEDELREEEELQMALALSQSEAEHKEQEKKRATSAIISNTSAISNSSFTNATSFPSSSTSVFSKVRYSPPPSPEPSPLKLMEEEEVDPELAKYLNRQHWEQRQAALEAEEQTPRLNVTSPSAPNISSPMPQKVLAMKQTQNQPNGEVDPEMQIFIENLKSQVEIFVNRMKSNSSRGRSIANDSSVQTLFLNITALHSRLLRYIQNQEDKRVYFEGLQDKLTQIKDARGALNALREENRLHLLQEEQEAQRKKQIQMAQKLEIMRKQKQETLQYQRELALASIQEQEREMKLRLEQQKQQYKTTVYPSSLAGYIDVTPTGQVSPAGPISYSGSESNFASIPGSGQILYSYPMGATGTYSVPAGYMMHQQQSRHLVDPNLIPDSKIPTTEAKNSPIQESLGRVTISGPAIVNQMSTMQSTTQTPLSSQPTPHTQLQSDSTPVHIPNCSQPMTNASLSDNIMSTQVGPTSLHSHVVPFSNLQNGQMLQQQPQQVQSTVGPLPDQAQVFSRSMVTSGQMGISVPATGSTILMSSNSNEASMPVLQQQLLQEYQKQQLRLQQMQGLTQGLSQGLTQMPSGPLPQSLQGSMNTQDPQQIQHLQRFSGTHPQMSTGHLPQLHSNNVGLPKTQETPMSLAQAQLIHQQQQHQLQQQQQLQPQQHQPNEPQHISMQEEGRKSPETAELISFD